MKLIRLLALLVGVVVLVRVLDWVLAPLLPLLVVLLFFVVVTYVVAGRRGL